MPSFGRYLDAELVEQLDRLRSSTRRNVDGLGPGSHRSLIKGAGSSFRQHRGYVRGDDLRRLDWRLLARTDRLFVKEFDYDTNLQCVIAVDVSGSMAYDPSGSAKSAYAATLATSLAYVLLRGGESVGVALLNATLDKWLPPSQGPTQLSQVIELLERANVTGAGNLSSALDGVRSRLNHRSLLIVVSDFFIPPGPLGRGLAAIALRGHEIVCARVLHPDEITFPFRTFTRLKNLESERSQVAEPATDRSAYLRRFRRHSDALGRACTSGRSALITARTDQPVVGMVEQLLRRRFTLLP